VKKVANYLPMSRRGVADDEKIFAFLPMTPLFLFDSPIRIHTIDLA
jgi:hypothetical protein